MKSFSFFRNIAGLLLLNCLIKPLWIFGVDRQVQNTVGHEAYGTYFSLLNLSLIFSFLLDAGLSGMANRQLAAGEPYNVTQLLRLKASFSVLYALLVAVVAFLAGVQQGHLLLFVIFIQILLSFFNFLRSIITAHQLFRWDVWLSVLDKTLMLLLFLPLLYTPLFQKPISILFFVQMQAACTAASVGVAAALVWKERLLHPTAAVQKWGVILKQVAPYAGIILLMATHNRLDGFLLERLHPNGAYEAGVYAAAYRLLDAASMVGFLVASFLVPFIARHTENKIVVAETIAAAGYGLLLFGSCVALFVVLLAGPVQQALYPASSLYTAQVLQWCLPVLPAYLLLHIYGSLLTAMAQLKLFIRLLAVAAVINAVLNSVLIPVWGAVGCCVAALVSQFVCALGVAFFAIRKNGLQHNNRLWAYLGAAVLLLAVLFFFGRRVAPPLLLAVAGGAVVLLALFAYLPRFKRSFLFS